MHIIDAGEETDRSGLNRQLENHGWMIFRPIEVARHILQLELVLVDRGDVRMGIQNEVQQRSAATLATVMMMGRFDIVWRNCSIL